MPSLDEQSALPRDFSGEVRLFPLPSLVMFPHALQALHIFEPRYQQMLEDALATDRLLATALLQPGWESEYDRQPAIFPVTCVGRVVSHTRLENGEHNILLLGLRRATVIRELSQDREYRRAEVAVLEDLYPSVKNSRRARVQQKLLSTFRRCFQSTPDDEDPFQQLLDDQLPLGVLTDIVASTLKFDLAFKQRLLSEWNVDTRARLILRHVESLSEEDVEEEMGFPPRFSQN